MRTMLDSVNPEQIPTTAAMVAGYIDGPASRWPAAGWTRFAGRVRVAIATNPRTNNAHVLDVEKYDARPEDALPWVRMRRASGCDPSAYCTAGSRATIQADFAAVGERLPHWWAADWSGGERIPEGAVACQWKPGPLYDTSVVADFWPGVDNGQTWPDDVAKAVQRTVAAVPVVPLRPDLLARLALPIGSAGGFPTVQAWEAARAEFLSALA
jgi:hypothetical protein